MIKYVRNYIFIEGTIIWNSWNFWNSWNSRNLQSHDFKLYHIRQNERVLGISRNIQKIITLVGGFLIVRDLKNDKILYIKKEYYSGINSVEFTNNSDILVMVQNEYIRTFSIVNNSYVRKLCCSDKILTFSCSPNGEYFAVVTSNET